MTKTSFPLFFVPVILIMIVPTVTTITYAQTFEQQQQQPSDLSQRQYGPQAANGAVANNNFTLAINYTAAGGIQDMRQLLLSLEPDIQEHNLTDTFNEIVLAFAYIQANVTALQNHTSNITAEAAAAIIQAQRDAADARADATNARTIADAAREELEATRAEAAAADTTEETTTVVEEATSPSPTTEDEPEPEEGGGNNNSGESEEENDGPRLDPEGDGGFPGDLDG